MLLNLLIVLHLIFLDLKYSAVPSVANILKFNLIKF